jgi:single-strand DNA-binding protein
MEDAMNQVNLIGRLVRDPKGIATSTGTTVAKLTLAIARPIKKESAQDPDILDFVPVTAFNRTAEVLLAHAHQGDLISVEGSIRTDRYERDGVTRYGWGVVARRVGLLARKRSADNGEAPEAEGAVEAQGDEPEEVPETADVPF